MTDRQPTLRPGDIVVALQLALESNASFAELSAATGLSVGECHNAVRRLSLSGLLGPWARRPVRELLTRFLLHGVPHAFPALIGPSSLGIPTAHSAPAFAGRVATDERFVWPDADGTERGLALTPLFPGAARTARKNPALYDLLVIVDALRVGHARERKAAEALLHEKLPAPDPALSNASTV
jgi:hypothetical protein